MHIKERITNGVWRPSIFDKYARRVVAGNSTKELICQTKQADLTFKKLMTELDPKTNYHNVIRPELNHTDNVFLVQKDFVVAKTKTIPDCDGAITNLKGYPIFMLCADCPPVAVYDPINNVIGLFHSGWKGTLTQIAPKGIKLMTQKYGSDPRKLLVSVGPSISQKNYSVTSERYQKFTKVYDSKEIQKIFLPSTREGYYLLDLKEAIKISLEKSGVKEKNVEISRYCTYGNNDKFSSHRKKGDTSSRTGYCVTLK